MKSLQTIIFEKLKLADIKNFEDDNLDSLKNATKEMIKKSIHLDKHRLDKYINGDLTINLKYTIEVILDDYSNLLTDDMESELLIYLKGDSTNEEISKYYDIVYQAMEEYFKKN